ncbi:hypothetical protein IFM89_012180 [Coptis chinensis]|uniref:Replication factor A C-terminal domain-containing protein n=1 Tax=Coptis chinensis TaxID=261450 RepID=A0A835HCC8_9MAGN|nr:hypothetical protein IFM89_012180 [Coptis chinensis]
MEGDQPSTLMCGVVAMDKGSFCYRVCAVCERTLSENSPCGFCNFKGSNPGSKRLYKILLSIASDTKVFVVVCFDRAARVLFGCSADEFFDFAKLNPFSVVTAGKLLQGEMFQMTLSKPKNGNAEHLRVVSVVPLRTEYSPVIQTLKKIYGVGPSTSI